VGHCGLPFIISNYSRSRHAGNNNPAPGPQAEKKRFDPSITQGSIENTATWQPKTQIDFLSGMAQEGCAHYPARS
jgi:hypothetical protein